MNNNDNQNEWKNVFEKNETNDFFADADLSQEDTGRETSELFSQTTDTDSIFGDDNADEMYMTMGLQMEYTDRLAQVHDNRKIESIQYVDVNSSKITEITQKLIKEYGENSKQVRKWLEQLNKIETYRKLQIRAIKNRRAQSIIVGVLSGIGVLLIALCVFFLFNSVSYYINLGDYNHIYKKAMFTSPVSISDVSAIDMEKVGSSIYYIDKESSELYKLDLKTKESVKVRGGKYKYVDLKGKTLYLTDMNNKTLELNVKTGEISNE